MSEIVKARCYDCDKPYGDEHGFPDLVVTPEVWAKISHTGNEGGLLCPNCMCKRGFEAGLHQSVAVFTSGPFASHGNIAALAAENARLTTALENARKDAESVIENYRPFPNQKTSPMRHFYETHAKPELLVQLRSLTPPTEKAT